MTVTDAAGVSAVAVTDAPGTLRSVKLLAPAPRGWRTSDRRRQTSAWPEPTGSIPTGSYMQGVLHQVCRRPSRYVLPDPQDCPSGSAEQCVCLCVTRHVGTQLGVPP